MRTETPEGTMTAAIALDLSDTEFDTIDRIEDLLEAAGPSGLTPSLVGRNAGISTDDARRLLQWMVAGRYAHTSGNGAWTRYHAGRGR
jgi:hypothetical protein